MRASSRLPELGRRGGGWVAAQTVLVAGIAVAARLGGDWPHGLLWPARVAAFVLVPAGIAIAVISARRLGRGFTTLPRPKESAQLVQDGPYALVRHPIYTAGLAAFLGVSLAVTSWPSLVLTLALGVLWDLKSRREEAWLAKRFPGYEEYRRRTPRRLIPYVY